MKSFCLFLVFFSVMATSVHAGKWRDFTGLHVRSLNDKLVKYLHLKSSKGKLVQIVDKDSPGEKAGLKPYDIILNINKKTVSEKVNMDKAARSFHDGKKLLLTVWRKSKVLSMQLVVDESWKKPKEKKDEVEVEW